MRKSGKRPPETFEFDNEIKILTEYTKSIIYDNLSPHIIELIYYKTCNVDKLIPAGTLCEDLQKSITPTTDFETDILESFCNIKSLIDKGIAYNQCSFLVLEHGDISFDKLLHDMYISPVNLAIIKLVLFQVIYTLYAIETIYPTASHNDLHTANVVIVFDHDCKFNTPMYITYVCSKLNTEFSLPYFGIISKIIDFGNSTIPEKNIMPNTTSSGLSKFVNVKNDILLFLHYVYNIMVLHHDSGDIADLLKQIEPNQTYIKYNVDHINNISSLIPTYAQMLISDAFGNYKNVNIPLHQRYKTYKC